MMAAAQYLLYLLALFLPWYPYLDLPQYLLVPTAIIMLALIALFLIDAVRRGWRVPFELTLPLVLVMLLIIYQTCSAWWLYAKYSDTFQSVPAEVPRLVNWLWGVPGLLWPLLIVAVLHFSPGREVPRAAMKLYAASMAAWAAAMLLAQVLPIFPTPYSIGIQKWTPLGPVVYALAFALFAACKRESPGWRAWGVASAMLGTALVILLMPVAILPGIKWPPGLPPLHVSCWALGTTLLVLWPVARIAAKIEVIRRESVDRWAPTFFLVLLAVIAIDIIRPLGLQVGAFFLVALAGAWTLPQRETTHHYKPDWKLALVAGPFGVLLVFNLSHVNPANWQDPRNYTSSITGSLQMPPGSQLPDFEVAALNEIEARFPQETQTNYWLAYIRLARGQLYGAATEYRKALQETQARTILPPPSDEQRRAFMDKLRDRASALRPGEHRGAYVLALSTEGRFDEALALMRHDTAGATPPAIEDSARPVLAAAVAVYLCQPDLSPKLADWTAGDLLALLTAWGAAIEPRGAVAAEECGLVIMIGAPGACDCAEGLTGNGVVASCIGGGSGVAIAGCGVESEEEQVPVERQDGAPTVVIWLKK